MKNIAAYFMLPFFRQIRLRKRQFSANEPNKIPVLIFILENKSPKYFFKKENNTFISFLIH